MPTINPPTCVGRSCPSPSLHNATSEAQPGERVMSGSLSNHALPTKKNLARSFVGALVLIPIALLAQSLTPPYAGQAELSKVEERVLSQGAVESIAPELAAILGVGSDRLPVKLKSYRMSNGISL